MLINCCGILIILTLKHRETHGCVVNTVATDALVLKHGSLHCRTGGHFHFHNDLFIVIQLWWQFGFAELRYWFLNRQKASTCHENTTDMPWAKFLCNHFKFCRGCNMNSSTNLSNEKKSISCEIRYTIMFHISLSISNFVQYFFLIFIWGHSQFDEISHDLATFWELTHWGRGKMAAIFQTAISNAFSWMKMYKFRLIFHWRLFPRVQLTIFQH